MGIYLTTNKIPPGTLIQAESWMQVQRKQVVPGSIGLVLNHEEPLKIHIAWFTFTKSGEPSTFISVLTSDSLYLDASGWCSYFRVLSFPENAQMEKW